MRLGAMLIVELISMISKNKSEYLPELVEPGWRRALAPAMATESFHALDLFLAREAAAGKVVYPPREAVFAAFNATPLKDVRCVILGQDPYHAAGQAHGLSFSVPTGMKKLPPSLRNIFKELGAEGKSGDLSPWAKRGVLLLNTSLTVEEGKAGSHAKAGWEKFTDAALLALASERDGLAYVLWGAHAQKKAAFIDKNRNFVLETAHPSPLSAYRGFLGSKPFAKVNQYLTQQGSKPIDWALS